MTLVRGKRFVLHSRSRGVEAHVRVTTLEQKVSKFSRPRVRPGQTCITLAASLQAMALAGFA